MIPDLAGSAIRLSRVQRNMPGVPANWRRILSQARTMGTKKRGLRSLFRVVTANIAYARRLAFRAILAVTQPVEHLLNRPGHPVFVALARLGSGHNPQH